MEPTKPPRIYPTLFFLAASFGIGYVCFHVLKPFFGAIAWSIVLAIAFDTPWNALERRMPRHRGLAAGLMTVAIALVVLLPAGLFAGMLTSQALDLANHVSETLQTKHVSSFSDFVALPEVARILDQVNQRAGISPDDFAKLSTGFATRASGIIATLSGHLVLGVFDAILTFTTTLFLVFFLFRDGRELLAAVLGLLPTDTEGRSAISGRLQRMIQGIFRGSMVCAFFQGLTGAIGWWISGLGSPALAGAAMAVLSLLPIGGTAILWIPGALWLGYSGHIGAAIFLLIWCATVTAFLADNVLRPILIGHAEELSMLVVFLGVFGGLAAFGLLGIFIGPVALVLATTLLEVMRREAGTGVVAS